MAVSSEKRPSAVPPLINTPQTGSHQNQDDLSILEHDGSMPIAIVGIGFRGPGDATNVERLFKMITEGREAWSEIPQARWNNAAFYHPDHSRHGTINVKGGHFLHEDISLFDAPFFNMTSDEASAMDPQQRLLLEVTYEGLENAGIPLPTIMGSQTSCFVGSFNADYMDLLLRDPDCVPMYQCTNSGQSRAMTANRISYFFDLKGPSVTVDTACSGSLVALHLACQSLRTGDASIAIAGGVNVILSHEFMSTMTMMKFLSPDGRCRTFDEKADGYARGEGVGCLILKPLRDAIRDSDNIRAIIRGSGSNQDGRTSGITLPNGLAQEGLIRHVYHSAGIDPSGTDFVEAHGTGTQAGDPIETGALARVFGPNRNSEHPLRIGSIKTNVGHLEGSSGIAGVVKAVLMLERRTLLPNLQLDTLNPRILANEWNLKVQLQCEPWETCGPHRVSVNSFGYGGSNAHVILEDAEGYLSQRNLIERVRLPLPNVIGRTDLAPQKRPRSRIFIMSAFDEPAVMNQTERVRVFLEEECPNADDEWMNNLAFTLNERRTAHLYRLAVIADSAPQMLDALSINPKIQKAPKRPTIGFIFTGQGAQWPGMGKELLEAYPVFEQSLLRIDAYLSYLGSPFQIIDEILEPEESSRLSHPLRSQPICSALQIALVDLLASWGIHPDSVTGHSSGEIAAAYAAGVLSMEDAMAVAYFRGVAASRLSENYQQLNGAMLAVGMSSTDIEPYIRRLKNGKAVVACINSPSSITISGDSSAVEELEILIQDKQVFSRRLAVEVAYHSHHMELVGGEYLASIAHVKARSGEGSAAQPSAVQFFSSVIGKEIAMSELGPRYWVRNLLGQVKFVDAIQALCFETSSPRHQAGITRRAKRSNIAKTINVDCLVEIGPHSALSGPTKQIIRADTKLSAAHIEYTSVLVRKNDAVTTSLAVAASLACSGHPINFQAVNNPVSLEKPRLLHDLPPYGWNHTRAYWAEPRVSKAFRHREHPRTDLLGVSDRFSSPFEPRWRNFIRVSELPWLQDHKIESNIVYPAAGYIAMAIEAAAQSASESETTHLPTTFILRDVSILSALVIPEASAVEVVISLNRVSTDSDGLASLRQFNVYSVTKDNRWTEHCNGYVGLQRPDWTSDTEETDSLQTMEPSEISVLDTQHFYRHLSKVGLEYGPCFTNITQVHFTDGVCFSEIGIPDTAAVMPMGFQYPFIIHPCALDSIIHSVFVDDNLADTPAVPVRIQEMIVTQEFPTEPGSRVDVCTKTTMRGRKGILSSITATSEHNLVLSITGLQCKYIGHDFHGPGGKVVNRIAYNLKWRPDPSLLSEDMLSSLLIENNVSQDQATELNALYEACALHYIRAAVRDLGDRGIENFPGFRKRALDNLLQFPSIDTQVQTLPFTPATIEDVRSSGPHGRLLCAIGEKLMEILTTDPKDTIIEHEALSWAEYCESLRDSALYGSITTYLNLMGNINPMLSVLEIEANKGGAQRPFLEFLIDPVNKLPRCGQYTFAHPRSEWFEDVAEIPSEWHELVHFEQFNIEKDLESQSIGKNSYDIVLVPYGLYTVHSVPNALKNLHSLLRPGGNLLMISPLSSTKRLADAVISSSFPETHIAHMKTASELHRVLAKSGFSRRVASVEFAEGFMAIVGKDMQEPNKSSLSCLIIAEDKSSEVCLPHLRELLESTGPTTEVSNLESAEAKGKFCIWLSDLSGPVLPNIDERELAGLKRMFEESAGLLWITKGSQVVPVDARSGLVSGFARTARSESGVDPIITLDLDGQEPLRPQAAASFIHNFFLNRVVASKPKNTDTEYAERGGVLFVPRVIEDTGSNELLASLHDPYSRADKHFHQHDGCLRAVSTYDEEHVQVHFTHDTQSLEVPDDHVRINVHAIALSKAVVSPSLESQSENACLAHGWSGIVQAVGKAVQNLVPGDRVACLGSGTVTNKYQTSEEGVQKIPPQVSFEQAASFPPIYCMAFYAVHHLANLGRTDSVLVYTADDIISRAIVDICRISDAGVFAIVDSSSEGEILSNSGIPTQKILRSQNGRFAKHVKELTNGKGVDVVINCGGSSRRLYEELWKCADVSGRVVQISDTDTTKKAQWEIPNLRTGVTFSILDANALLQVNPAVLHEIWHKVAKLLYEGRIKHLSSLASYKITDISKALEDLSSKNGPEFVVITADISDSIKTIQTKQSKALLRNDASYMLVGGLGGIGRATALWMADHGAQTLIFINRSGLTRAASKATARALEDKGVRVIVRALDISDSRQVATTLAELAEDAPPIRGVIQAAMVLKDTHIAKMTLDDYHSVIQPKFSGTWNLHNHLPGDLDWFIMLSSISGIIGNATQAAYAAGSTFMDGFAAYRNSLGLQAVSLDLGVITDVGYLAENTELAAKMAEQGFQGTDTATLMSLIELAMMTPPGNPSSSQIITGLGVWKEGHSLSNFDAPLFAHFRRPFQKSADTGTLGSAGNTLREDLKAAKTIEDASALVCTALSAKIAAHLSVPVDNIAPGNPITEYGIDSHVAVEMRNWISKTMESTVPILEILATGSLVELAMKIAEKSTLVNVEE